MRVTVLPDIAARMALLDALDPARLSTGALATLFNETRHRLVTVTHVAVDRVNIMAQFTMDEAHRVLVREGFNPAAVLSDAPQTMLHAGLRRLADVDGQDRLQALHALMGHRSDADYELCAPRYGEDRRALVEAASQLAAMSRSNVRGNDAAALPPDVRHAVVRAQCFVALKEDAKHESLREIALLRRVMLAMDARFGLQGAIFFLTLHEACSLTDDTRRALLARAEARQSQFTDFKSAPALATQLTLRDIELGPMAGSRTARDAGASQLAGTRVSGHLAVEGRAIAVAPDVCESGAPIPGFEPGDIIVARMLHPAWLPQMMTCGGVVVEAGGWLSHMAILARERGLAMSVGVRGVDTIRTGMRLRLEADGGVVCL